MKYKIYLVDENTLLEETDIHADTDHEAAEYAFLQAQFTGYENYLLSCRSEDKLFDMMVSGHRGTHIKP